MTLHSGAMVTQDLPQLASSNQVVLQIAGI
jgi:hypothetical protein